MSRNLAKLSSLLQTRFHFPFLFDRDDLSELSMLSVYFV